MAIRGKLELAWDYSAEPTWINGVNYLLEDVVKNKIVRREIKIWYAAFSKAEELLHETNTKNLVYEKNPLSKKELKQVRFVLKTILVPWEEQLAKKIGAKLKVDWGH